MESYKSIETIYVRNPETHVLELGKVRLDAAEAVRSWVITEKVDGMNMRAIFSWTEETGLQLAVRGRTDMANLTPQVIAAVERAFRVEAVGDVMVDSRQIISRVWETELKAGKTVTFYGEAFGEGIQKNPLRMAGVRFYVFDILVGEKTWMRDDQISLLADQIGFKRVPMLGLVHGLPETKEQVDELTGGFSRIATERIRPEGIVARPILPLFDTWGNRIIWKLTYREYDKLAAVAAREKATPPTAPDSVLTDEEIKASEGGAITYNGQSFSVIA